MTSGDNQDLVAGRILSGCRARVARGYGQFVVSDDFLDEMIAERESVDPAFPALLNVAVQRRQAVSEEVADDAPEAK